MASDIKILLIDNEYDIQYEDGDLIRDDGLETAVLMSIFTDKRAADDDQIDGDDKRGWWGDQFEPDEIGSKIWQLYRQKISPQTLTLARQYIQDCLQWMVDDGVCQAVEVITEITNLTTMGFEVHIFYADGSKVSFKYKDLWEAQYAA